MNKIPIKINDWREKFDSKFNNDSFHLLHEESENIKSFISNLLLSQKASWIERVKGMEKDELYVGETQYRFEKGNIAWVYNQAIDDVLSILEKE